MTKTAEIQAAVNQFAPFDTAEDFDNVGLLVGDEDSAVSRCLVTLDVTAEVVQEAAGKGCQLILSHHPVIFLSLKRVSAQSVPGKLLKAGIGVLSPHTNVDKAGLNPALAELLNIRELEPLPETGGCAGIGLPPRRGIAATELALMCKKALSLKGARVCDTGRPVEKVALCCGGGGSFLPEILKTGADCFITGDVKHDQVVDAANAGVRMIDLGHFETEVHFISLMIKLLKPQFPDVLFLPADTCRPLFTHI